MGNRVITLLSSLVGAIVILVAAEVIFRLIWKGSPEFDLYRMHMAMSIERWTFLTSKADELEMDSALNTYRPWIDFVEPPELDRPPFDRVAVAYRITTNGDGFRERALEWVQASPLVFVVGDSVTFGKGVEEEDRFTRLIEARFFGNGKMYALAIPGCASDCISKITLNYLAEMPDLLILQASTNDIDLSLWRESRKQLPLWITRLAQSSRLALAVAHALLGDRTETLIAQAEEAAIQRYSAYVEKVFDAAEKAGVKIAVFQVPMADGRRYNHTLVRTCKARPDQCIGLIELKLEACRLGPIPDWVLDTAELLDLPVEVISTAFPLAPCFYDVVHPNITGNAMIADELGPTVMALLHDRGLDVR